jgi:glycosyltransferase involved in cell wall biosynthesis
MDLAGYLGYFDVCIIPFVLNDLIRNTNPVKFYEYISSGKPVVSVRLPELEVYSDICYLADTKEEFSNCIKKSLEEESILKEKRMKVARENSWDERVEEILKLIYNHTYGS